MKHSQRQSTLRIRRLAVSLACVVLPVVGLSVPAGADVGCGENGHSFSDVQLINDDWRGKAGPFAVNVAAGTYDITMISWDAHDEHYQPEQDQEQWYFSLDSGYVSAPSIDIPTEDNTVVTVLKGQDVAASTAVTFHHLRQGNANSVQPVCIGFSPVVMPEAEPVTEDVPPTEPAEPEPEVQDQPAPSVEPEVKGIVERAPVTNLVPPASLITRPPAPAVLADVAPAPQLALTGPASANMLTAYGVSLLLVGTALVVATDRKRAVVER